VKLLFRKKKQEIFPDIAEEVRLLPGEVVVGPKCMAMYSPALKTTVFFMGDYRHLSDEEVNEFLMEQSKRVLK
jgi:hypothetical protein